MAYTIGSAKGQKIANNMGVGTSYKASDGSTWTKNKDGSISVTSASGNVTQNAYQAKITGSSPTTGTMSTTGSSKSGGTSSSGGYSIGGGTYNPNNSSNTNTVTNTKTTSVKPNVPDNRFYQFPTTSVNNQKQAQQQIAAANTLKAYNGVNYNTDTDYQALINQAVNTGDYASARQYEMARNAKIQGEGLSNKYGITSNYGNMSFADLPANWSTAYINGDNYTQQNGNIYKGNEFVGDRIIGNSLGFSSPELVTDAAKQNFYNGQLSRDLLRYGFNMNDVQNMMGSLLDTYTAQALVNGDTDDLTSAIIDGLLTQQARAEEQAYVEQLQTEPTQQQDEFTQLLQQYLLMMMMQGMNLGGNYLNGATSAYSEAYQNYINKMLGFSNMNIR